MLNLDFEKVAGLLRELGDEVVMPRFRALSPGDIAEKGPGDLVTLIDHEVERRLSEELVGFCPRSRCIGEEACHLNPELLPSLGDGWTWLIDPIDGTRNFVAGDRDFSIMVALLRDGELVASWMHAPAAGWSAACERGAGATVDGGHVAMPIRATSPGVIYTRFLPDTTDRCIAAVRAEHPDAGPGCGSAGCDYYALVRGQIGFAIFWRTLSWDHAAGALFVVEAGGEVARANGDRYRPVEEGRRGLVAAPKKTWQDLARQLQPCFGLET